MISPNSFFRSLPTFVKFEKHQQQHAQKKIKSAKKVKKTPASPKKPKKVVESSKGVPCHICNKTLFDERSLTEHRLRIHKLPKLIHQCPDCDR